MSDHRARFQRERHIRRVHLARRYLRLCLYFLGFWAFIFAGLIAVAFLGTVGYVLALGVILITTATIIVRERSQP